VLVASEVRQRAARVILIFIIVAPVNFAY
jgi:hypothetical protein